MRAGVLTKAALPMEAARPTKAAQAIATIATAGLLCAALAGCTAAPPALQEESPGAASSGRFTGPWADLFEQTYAQVTADDEKAALDDGEITAEEYAYFQDKILQCLVGLGVTGQFNPDGSLDYDKPDAVSTDDIRDCNVANGIRVLALHDAILRNPTHLDETTIMLECLQRTGAVGVAYTRADLDNGVDLDVLGTTPEFAGCAADPLNYEGE